MSSPLATAPATATPWVSDQGDGTFRNPVLYADFSDPDAIRVGNDFYMTASSFQCIPGLPILHSTDLVNWSVIAYAVTEGLPQDRFNKVATGGGIWAPSIRYHDGWYWIFVGDPDWGMLMTRARDPRGPWTPLHVIAEGKGYIDTCPLWDDDGQAYLVHAFAGSRAGIKDVLAVHRLAPDGSRLLDEGTIVFDGRGGIERTIEGPKFYKRNGWYYIFAPSGGVTHGWQLVLRSRSPFGPYERRRVLEQGKSSINGPHQGAWVELANGEDWFLHFQDLGPYGRVVHLQPMKWTDDDWPTIGVDADGNGVGEPVLEWRKPTVPDVPAPEGSGLETSDDFDSTKLGLQWQWHSNPRPHWSSLYARPGWLRLAAVERPDDAPNLTLVAAQLLQKFTAPEFTVTTKLEWADLNAAQITGSEAGLIINGEDSSALLVRFAPASAGATAGNNGSATTHAPALEIRRVTTRDTFKHDAVLADQVEAVAKLDSSGPIWLRVHVAAPSADCTFSYSADGESYTTLGPVFRAREGRWVGAKVGLLCMAPTGAKTDTEGRPEKDDDAPVVGPASVMPGAASADFDFFHVE